MYNQSQKSENFFFFYPPPPPCAFENGALCSIQEPFFLLSSKYLDSLFLPIYPPSKKEEEYFGCRKCVQENPHPERDPKGPRRVATNCLPRDRQRRRSSLFFIFWVKKKFLSRKLRKGDGGSDSLFPPYPRGKYRIWYVWYILFTVCPPSFSFLRVNR
jgi:hypothetical protein